MDTSELENIRIKYQGAINLKDSESQIQWSRFNAILVVNTVLIGLIGINYSGAKELPHLFKDLVQFMPFAGIVISVLWFWITLRGFRWSQFWIRKAKDLEKDLVGGINPIHEGSLGQRKYLKTEYAAYLIILIFLLMYAYILPLGGIKFPLRIYININALQFSQIFNNITVGIGAFLAGAGGFKILFDWTSTRRESQRRERLRAELKVKYPPSQHKKTYRLIESNIKPDWVYLHDLNSNKKHHLASMGTLLRLGYLRSWAKKISPKEFVTIPEGDEFLTDGERYT